MKIILFVLICVLVHACTNTSRKVLSKKNVQDSLAMLIVRSELGLPVLVKSNKEMKTLFNGTADSASDTFDIHVFQLDLLTISERSYTGMNKSLPIQPGDSIEVSISLQDIHFFFIEER